MFEGFYSFFGAESTFQVVVLTLSLTATLIMLIQLVLLIIGMGHADSFDADAPSDTSGIGDDGTDCAHDGVHDGGDTDGLHTDGGDDIPSNHTFLRDLGGIKIFTLRNLFAFLSIGGWVMFFLSQSSELWIAIPIGFLAGAAIAVIQSILFKLMYRLERSGTISYKNAIGMEGEVYVPIQSDMKEGGKVMLMLQGRLMECDAVSEHHEKIPTGAKVKVVRLADVSTLVVERIEDRE